MTDEELRVRAIQELEFYKKDDTFMLADITVDLAIKALEQEPKQGKWIQAKDIEKEYAVCTNCKHHGEFYMDYCPNCGARMESDEE